MCFPIRLFLIFSFFAGVITAGAPDDESSRANAFFKKSFEAQVDRDPEMQSRLGIKKDYGKWTDRSDAFTTREIAIAASELATLRSDFDFNKLNSQTRLSYLLFEYRAEREIRSYRWRFYNYPVNQMHGLQSEAPAFLINIHRISDANDAEAYISRLRGLGPLINQLIENLEIRKEKGIVIPKFVFPMVLIACHNLIKGQPFNESGNSSSLWEDFNEKIEPLENIESIRKKALLADARNALLESVGPAYNRLIDYLHNLETFATDDDGVWKFPDGDTFYADALRNTTTTNLTAEEIHHLGLEEVARIHGEMLEIKEAVGFEGELQAFFDFMRTDTRFYYPETKEGKQTYLDGANIILDEMKTHLDKFFITAPQADLRVKAVEAFREKSAGKAFYQRPALDGSRPGTYYVNLRQMADMPSYQMEALAFHEGVPGHHLQIAIAQETEGIPDFRRHTRFTAFTEGWGLYSEYFPREFGFYKDPYSDFGRLAMEIWRAARLVVDTGIHAKKWTRQEAIDYLIENTPNPKGDCIHAINRYIVMPSQATAYKIGMIKILQLREWSKEQLADQFDLREFHELVLTGGPMPLNLLEQQVQQWVQSKL